MASYAIIQRLNSMLNKTSKFIALPIMVLMFAFGGFIPTADAYVSVKGYYRSDGTYVRPYVRSNPNGLKYDNYSWTPSQGLYNKTYGTRGSSWNTPTWTTDPDYYTGKSIYESNNNYRNPTIYKKPSPAAPIRKPERIQPSQPVYTPTVFDPNPITTSNVYQLGIAPQRSAPSIPAPVSPSPVFLTPQAREVSINDNGLTSVSNEQIELFNKLDDCYKAPNNWKALCVKWKNRTNNFGFLGVGSNSEDMDVLQYYFPKPRSPQSIFSKPLIPSYGGDCPSGYVKIESGNCRGL